MKKTIVQNILFDIISVLFRGLPKTIAAKISEDKQVKKLATQARTAIQKLQNTIKQKQEFLKKNNII